MLTAPAKYSCRIMLAYTLASLQGYTPVVTTTLSAQLLGIHGEVPGMPLVGRSVSFFQSITRVSKGNLICPRLQMLRELHPAAARKVAQASQGYKAVFSGDDNFDPSWADGKFFTVKR